MMTPDMARIQQLEQLLEQREKEIKALKRETLKESTLRVMKDKKKWK